MSYNGQKIIEQKQKQETAAREMRLALEADEAVRRIANFEVNTTKKIEAKMAEKRFNELKAQRNLGVLERRTALAALYNDEIEQWKQEVMAKVETIEERKDRIMQKAYALRDAREQARNEYIQQCYDKQWRAACDDARTLDSKAFTKWATEERLTQIARNERTKEQNKLDEREWYENWQKQLAESDAREKAKSDFKSGQASDTADGIAAQMRYNYDRLQQHKLAQSAADQAEIERIRAEIAAEDAKQEARKQLALSIGKETSAFNQANKDNKAKESAVEAERDSILLHYALEKERREKQAEDDKREAQKQASIAYNQYLKEQMIKEAEDMGSLEAMRQAETEKVFKKQDDMMRARDDARAHLMKLVDEGRREQIAAKEAQEAAEKEAERLYASTFIEDARKGIERERTERSVRVAANQANNVELRKQIDARRLALERERQDTYLADKQMQRQERLHSQRLQEQGGQIKLHHPIVRSKWN